MSRRYCSVCREAHNNPQDGLCDKHLEEQETKRIADHNETAAQLNSFMGLSEEDRWKLVFDFMRERGFTVWG